MKEILEIARVNRGVTFMKNARTEQVIWTVSVVLFCLWCIFLFGSMEGIAYYLSIPLFFFFLGRALRVGILNWQGFAKLSGNYLEEALIDIMISSILTIVIGGTLASLFMLTQLNLIIFNGLLFPIFSSFWILRIRRNTVEFDRDLDVQKLGLDYKLSVLGVLFFSITYAVIR
ncbi:MAG: hypothetical protein ACFFEV_04255, partial [Candidatus Thorarchaeota archaeon]